MNAVRYSSPEQQERRRLVPFVKLDARILQSTIWLDVAARNVFITALLMAQPEQLEAPEEVIKARCLEPDGWQLPAGWYGHTHAAGPGIAQWSGLPQEEAMAAIERLCAPDRESRSKEFEGRRLARIDGGFVVLNYMRYRDYDHQAADRMRKLRARRKLQRSRNKRNVRPNVTDSRRQKTEDREQKAENKERQQTTTEGSFPETFVSAFNQALKRSCHVTPPLEKRIAERLKERAQWEILALPILIAANPPPREILDRLNPLMILRDGKHPRTTSAGYTAGATDWLEERISRIDQTTLSPKLVVIAERFGVLQPLRDLKIRSIEAEAV